MKIDESEEQSANAAFSMQESRQPGSKVTVERDSHRKKHFSQSRSLEEGKEIDKSDGQLANADFLTRES
jgi:hypothetical protein